MKRFFAPAIFSFVIMLFGLGLDYIFPLNWFQGWVRFVWYFVAYIPVGFLVLTEACGSILKVDFFSEFLLMGIATVGAYAIGEYPEGVAVMLFYSVGEVFQGMAVRRAKTNIKILLDQRPDEVTILEGNVAK